MNHDKPTTGPRSWGLCRYCLRDMWDGKPPPGKVRVSPCRTMCDTCAKWIERNGTDPRDSKLGPAERVPAERGEPDDDWKTDPERRCADLPIEFFGPELDRDDPEYVVLTDSQRDAVWLERRVIAARLCQACPVMDQCRGTAKAMGYEGLWGGAWFTRTRWQDLITGERGLTIHAAKRDRDRQQAQDAERVAA